MRPIQQLWLLRYLCPSGCHQSSVVSSAPTIMRSWVWIPSTPSTLFQFVLSKLWWEKDKNKQKEAGNGPSMPNKIIHYFYGRSYILFRSRLNRGFLARFADDDWRRFMPRADCRPPELSPPAEKLPEIEKSK